MFKKITLKNGLRIITVPQRNAQTAAVLVLVGTGSKYETKETNGISHFLEHVYFKGTKKRPSTMAVAETLDKIGGNYNAFTSDEYTGYYAKVAASQVELALDWGSDIYLNSLLPEKEIQKEKGVIVEEINMRYDHPMSYVHVLWNKLLYGDQPAGWDIAGTKKSVMSITRQDLVDYTNSQYSASNTICCVAGNFNDKEVVAKIKKYFSKISTQKSKERFPVIEKQKEPSQLLHFKKTDQTHLCLGVRAYNIFHPQKYAQEVLGVILGGMMSSRLFIEVREKLGIAYYVRTYSEANLDTGYLVTCAGIDNKNIEKAIKVILREYKKISEKGVPQQELKKAKDYIKGKTALFLESSDAQASFYASQELLERRILTPAQIFQRVDKVSKNAIMKIAKNIFQPEKLNLALIGPNKDEIRLQQLLKGQ